MKRRGKEDHKNRKKNSSSQEKKGRKGMSNIAFAASGRVGPPLVPTTSSTKTLSSPRYRYQRFSCSSSSRSISPLKIASSWTTKRQKKKSFGDVVARSTNGDEDETNGVRQEEQEEDERAVVEGEEGAVTSNAPGSSFPVSATAFETATKGTATMNEEEGKMRAKERRRWITRTRTRARK